MKNNSKKVKVIATAMALVGILAVGGITAYFTDTEHKPNVFTVGEGVDIELDEPGWDPTDPEHDEITPNKVFSKDPIVTNKGTIGAYTFVKVSVPYENIATANDNGTLNSAEDTQLFTYTVNSEWSQVGDVEKDTENKTFNYVYVYGSDTECAELAGGEVTPAVFNTVKFVDVAEGKVNGKTLTIDVNAYAIQTEDINGGTNIPVEVWSVISNHQ